MKQIYCLTKLFSSVILLMFCKSEIYAQNWNEVIKIVASDRNAADNFGYAVAISGDYAIVAANREAHDVLGNDSMGSAGSAYIIKNISGTWQQVQKIVASDRSPNDVFGSSVSISGDYAIVGAFSEDEDALGLNTMISAGSAYIFKNNLGTWEQVQKIVSSDRADNDWFGRSVAISGDYAVISAFGEDEDNLGLNTMYSAGSAYIFHNNSGTWEEIQKIVAADREAGDVFGYSVAISGNNIVVGAKNEEHDTLGLSKISWAGSAYIFENNAGIWSQAQKIVASDRSSIYGDYASFGYSVAISGNNIIVGVWSGTTDANGLNYISGAGNAYIYENISGNWVEKVKIVASDRAEGREFGQSVSISGDYAIVGAPQQVSLEGTPYGVGSAYIYKNNSGTWMEVQKILSSDIAFFDFFGYSVAISGENAIVGARGENEDTLGLNSMPEAGSTYIFRQATVNIEEENTEKDGIYSYPNPATDRFYIVCTLKQDMKMQVYNMIGECILQQATSIGTNDIDISALSKGIYVVKISCTNWSVQQKLIKK